MNYNKPELLVPAGDFDCLRAGVQNGADAIYLGGSLFSARANAKNFSNSELAEAIKYCKLRNVKTYLTLNTLLTDTEFSEAISLVNNVYEYGIDAIIVQDLGFGKFLIDNFPNLSIHASTQMSVHNLEGVLSLQKLGFKRVVLSRELSLNEIEYIKNNCSIELEVFIHGALCISYSGQCLFSSLVGGRSGNRGKCAQPCRLPYELIEETKKIDSGYLLSPRDLNGLEFIPELSKIGIASLKIEGRMKTPEYVAEVTKVYRKYIDQFVENNKISIVESDKKDLLQVFNRGNFSTGHLANTPNKNLIFPNKPNNMGIYIGNISNYNAQKGHIKVNITDEISIGDTISIEGETGTYTVSEIILNNKNLPTFSPKQATHNKTHQYKNIITLGRMKGNIKVGSKVYKISSKALSLTLESTYKCSSNIKKIPLDCSLSIKKNMPITINFKSNISPFYNNININFQSDIIPEESINSPISKERVLEQISKLGNTPYFIENFEIDLDENLHIPHISDLNSIRRSAIEKLENEVLKSERESKNTEIINIQSKQIKSIKIEDRTLSVLLESINSNYDYSKLTGFDNVYIPINCFINKKNSLTLKTLSQKFNMYIYLPTILKTNYKNVVLNTINNILNNYNIKGFVISNIGYFTLLDEYISNGNYDIVANYTMNTFNNFTTTQLKTLGITKVTPSIELNSLNLENLIKKSSLPIELIAYGKSALMNSSYCLLGKSNRCYPECDAKCSNSKKYYLKDRLGFNFRIIPDNLQTITTIYNSKTTSIDTKIFNVNSVRINFLDESIEEMNKIIKEVKLGNKLEGKDYTNGNLNREM